MKKLAYILLLFGILTFCSCNNVEKSRKYFDEGVELMMIKGNFAAAEEAFNNAIKYDKKNPELY